MLSGKLNITHNGPGPWAKNECDITTVCLIPKLTCDYQNDDFAREEVWSLNYPLEIITKSQNRSLQYQSEKKDAFSTKKFIIGMFSSGGHLLPPPPQFPSTLPSTLQSKHLGINGYGLLDLASADVSGFKD